MCQEMLVARTFFFQELIKMQQNKPFNTFWSKSIMYFILCSKEHKIGDWARETDTLVNYQEISRQFYVEKISIVYDL